MTKNELRKIFLQKRLALSDGEYLSFNLQLYNLFFSCIDLSFIRVLHIFLPIVKKKEPDTWVLVDRIRREFPHIQLSVPRIIPSSEMMENFNFEGPHQVRENLLGIPEPVQGELTVTEKIDMVVVPLLCFDKAGHRIGYGKGYYDRFLKNLQPACKIVGLAFFPPVDHIPEIEAHDIKMNAVVTPTQYYQF